MTQLSLNLARGVVTFGGVGLIKPAPGTWGSLAALPLAWLLHWLGGPWLLTLAAFALFFAGLWACRVQLAGGVEEDPPSIVVDEAVGQWLTLAVAPRELLAFAVGFLLFRLFDILKPWPIRQIERRLKGAFGVMVDDVLAAVYAALCLFVLLKLLEGL